MASPAEIAQGLPETLAEDFGDWDSESSPATPPDNTGGFEDDRGLDNVPKPSAPTHRREVTPTPAVDALSDTALPSPARVYADDRAFLHQQASSTPMAARLPNSVSYKEQAARSNYEVPFLPQRPKVSGSDGLSNLMGVQPAATLNPDAFLLSLRPKIAVTRKEKQPRKKWMMIAAVSACSILVLVILAIRLFSPRTPSTAKRSAEPGLTVTEVQLNNNTPKPSPSTPLTQDELPSATQTQPTVESQPTEEEEKDVPPEVQSNMMNDQLTATPRIPRDIKKPAVENEPPPSLGFATTGTETVGGNGAIASVFKGEARPIVHPAPSNTVTISAGVAVGLLTQKTQPIYPANR